MAPERHHMEIRYDSGYTGLRLIHPPSCDGDCDLLGAAQDHGLDAVSGKVVVAVEPEYLSDSEWPDLMIVEAPDAA